MIMKVRNPSFLPSFLPSLSILLLSVEYVGGPSGEGLLFQKGACRSKKLVMPACCLKGGREGG